MNYLIKLSMKALRTVEWIRRQIRRHVPGEVRMIGTMLWMMVVLALIVEADSHWIKAAALTYVAILVVRFYRNL